MLNVFSRTQVRDLLGLLQKTLFRPLLAAKPPSAVRLPSGAWRRTWSEPVFCWQRCSIKSTSDDVVSGTRKVLNTTTTDQNNAVLLQIVTFTGNVAGNFDSVGKTNSGDLSKS